jgi:hypothetical protein
MQNFKTLQQHLLGELAMSPERNRERKKEKKMPFIVATYVYASTQGQRTHSARTKKQLKVKTMVVALLRVTSIDHLASSKPFTFRFSRIKFWFCGGGGCTKRCVPLKGVYPWILVPSMVWRIFPCLSELIEWSKLGKSQLSLFAMGLNLYIFLN